MCYIFFSQVKIKYSFSKQIRENLGRHIDFSYMYVNKVTIVMYVTCFIGCSYVQDGGGLYHSSTLDECKASTNAANKMVRWRRRLTRLLLHGLLL